MTCIFLLPVTLAAVIPKLDLFISLVGSVSSSTLALMAPPIIDTITNWETMSKLRIVKNALIFTIGFLGFVTGSYVSGSQIIYYFEHRNDHGGGGDL